VGDDDGDPEEVTMAVKVKGVLTLSFKPVSNPPPAGGGAK